MPLTHAIPYQWCLSHLQGWKTNSSTAAPIYQETINRVISSYNFSLVNSYLPTASNKCLRCAIFNKPCLSMCCSPFVGILLGTIELTRRQFVGILKVCVIVFVRTVQTVLINNINGLLTVQRSFINVLLSRCCVRIIWCEKSFVIFQKPQDKTRYKIIWRGYGCRYRT